MRKIEIIVLVVGIIATLTWTFLSTREGFKGSNATIVSRSINIHATMDGQVENDPPAVGASVSIDDLLARVLNGRFDRGRLIEFESQIAYLESEIADLEKQQRTLDTLMSEFSQRAASYSVWMLNDAKLKHHSFIAQHDVAKAQKRLEDEEVERAAQLFDKQLTSEVEMQIQKTQAEIAGARVTLNQTELQRSALMLKTMEQDGMFFDDGDTSYWAKMSDTLALRTFDISKNRTMLQSQLVQAKTQASAEYERANSSYAEEHRAPFSGKVSARFVTQGTRVTAGTSLLQVLDCTQPVVIIPIPDNRVSDFAVGMKVSVYPIDSEQNLSGRIDYISSGPMLGTDTSIQIQQEITLEGNRAIVSLDGLDDPDRFLQSCETARVAVAVIHTDSLFSAATNWL